MSTNIPIRMTESPCTKCLLLARRRQIRMETVQRLPEGAWAPRDLDGNRCCYDCQAAENLMKTMGGMDFVAARIATGNARQEQYRLPGAPIGLAHEGFIRFSAEGDLEDQHAWLDKNDWFGSGD